MVVRRSCVAGHGNARFEQIAIVGLILHRDSHRHRLQALEARGGFKVRALFAAVQRRSALRTLALPVDIGTERRGAVKTASRDYVLEQPGKARACDVERRPGAVGLRPVGELAVPGCTIGVHVAPLSVLTVVIHV